MITTLRLIKEKNPCRDGWENLLNGLGKMQADDESLAIAKIIETNGVEDALWALRAVNGYDREKRLFACWCCDQIAHLITDERSKKAVTVARRFANGEVTKEELSSAADAAASYACGYYASTSAYAAYSAATAASYASAADADAAAAYAAAAAVARSAQVTELLRVCDCIKRGEDPYPK